MVPFHKNCQTVVSRKSYFFSYFLAPFCLWSRPRVLSLRIITWLQRTQFSGPKTFRGAFNNFFLDNSNAIQPFNWKKVFTKTHFGSFLAPENYRGKMTLLFFVSEMFACFEKNQKSFSGALRGAFRARKVFGSFEKRTPGLRCSKPESWVNVNFDLS